MSPRPSTLLGLVLCLGQMIHTLEGKLPKPSFRAEPGLVITRGRPVTFVCRGPAGAKLRLEKDGNVLHPDQKTMSQDGQQETEAVFLIPAVSEDTAGHYYCIYLQASVWSERSDPLYLQVTEEVIPTTLSGLSNQHIYILIGTSVAFLLCLLLLVLLLVYRHHQRKRESTHSKGEEQRPQQRLSPAADITENMPDESTVNAFPEKKGDLQSSSPTVGDDEEVTYAQLDQRALTLRAAQPVSPPPTEPTADASTYAQLPRR